MPAITCRTKIEYGGNSEAVGHAVKSLLRDIKAVCLPSGSAGLTIKLKSDDTIAGESYRIGVRKDSLVVRAGDELGFIYGLYAVSRSVLGVHDLWFWNDQTFAKKESWPVEDGFELCSKPYAVRYRGWFINDEVLLHAWRVDGSKDKPWEMAFEALLRLGGNMVIPGTHSNAHRYNKLASGMGLYITHHHAEPLGAPMFGRRHPDLTPSYDQHPGLFEALWREGIESQKGMKVVWNLGFRGQGDRPFWEDDPRCGTPQARGSLIGRLIERQYQMVREAYPNAPCCTNLYGEIMELWREGHLRLPGDVVRIWADNGYGKMVSRRQGNDNPRIRALPARKDRGKHGLYYHVSFYDLQAGNHLTMLGNPPSFVQRELSEALSLGVNEYWIVNCSNIKPHVFYLGFIAEFWRNGHFDPEAYGKEYAARTYGAGNARMAAACFDSYFRHAVPYGTQEDEHAGDQFFNYVARILVSQYMKDGARRAEELLWAVDAATLREQTEWFQSVCKNAAIGYAEHAAFCEGAVPAPEDPARTLFESSLQVQADILRFSADGALLACRSLLKAMDGDDMRAFFLAGKSKKAFQQANAAMRGSESGKWIGFYANDCLTDVKQSAWLMGCLMGMLRNRGDGPYFYEWQREILYSRQDARVMLITNMENHLDNDELFQRMEIKWDAE